MSAIADVDSRLHRSDRPPCRYRGDSVVRLWARDPVTTKDEVVAFPRRVSDVVALGRGREVTHPYLVHNAESQPHVPPDRLQPPTHSHIGEGIEHALACSRINREDGA